MRQSIYLTIAVVLCACSPERARLDDEAGSTTSPDDGEESESESGSSSSESSTETDADSVGDLDHFPETCDPFQQDCPPGYKCGFIANDGGSVWNDFACVEVLGDHGAGEPCTASGPDQWTDDCDATSWCFDGVCQSFCAGNPRTPICPPMSVCSISGDGVLTICLPTCDPLDPDCPEGQGCFWANDEFLCVSTTQNIPIGEPCGFINDCVAGAFCADASVVPNCAAMACCSLFCALDQPDCSALPGTECTAFFEDPAPEGYENVGVCVIPG